MNVITNLSKIWTLPNHSINHLVFSKHFQKVTTKNIRFIFQNPKRYIQVVPGQPKPKNNYKPSRFYDHIKCLNIHHEYLKKPSDLFPIRDEDKFKESLQNANPNDLMAAIITVKTEKVQKKCAIHHLDNICCDRMKEFDTKNMYGLLFSFYHVKHHNIIGLKFYKQSMEHLSFAFKDSKSLTKDEFVQYCFYLGLTKKSMWKNKSTASIIGEAFNGGGEAQASVLELFLEDLSTIEMHIVTNSAFRMSVPIACTDRFIKTIHRHILTSIESDEFAFIDFIKTLRHNSRESIPIVTKLLTDRLLENKFDQLPMPALVHVYAYFANSLLNDVEVTRAFIQKGIARIIAERNSQDWNQIRAKDIASFLWCCAHLNTRKYLAQSDFDVLEEAILHVHEMGQYETYPDTLIDTCLSLWMLNPNSQNIMRKVIATDVLKPTSFWGMAQKRLYSRTILLKSCVNIENPLLAKELGIEQDESIVDHNPASAYYMKYQPNLFRVFNTIKKYSNNFRDISKIEVVSPIRELNIAGICLTIGDFKGDERQLYLEVLEDNTTLSDGETPIGPVALKRRLLEIAGRQSILVMWLLK